MKKSMKKKSMKKIVPLMLLTVVMSLPVACSVDDTNSREADEMTLSSPVSSGVYEGEWTVNRQVVDTARLVVEGEMIRLRLPEEYLLSTYIVTHEKTDGGAADYSLSGTPAQMQGMMVGYSETSEYMSFSSLWNGSPDIVLHTLSVSCEFDVAINGTPYQVYLLSKDNPTAVVQIATGQWTLGVPIDGFLIKNLSTGESSLKELPSTVNIFYNTKRKIG